MNTSFTGLLPSTSYNVSVAVNMTYGIGRAVILSVITATVGELAVHRTQCSHQYHTALRILQIIFKLL